MQPPDKQVLVRVCSPHEPHGAEQSPSKEDQAEYKGSSAVVSGCDVVDSVVDGASVVNSAVEGASVMNSFVTAVSG